MLTETQRKLAMFIIIIAIVFSSIIALMQDETPPNFKFSYGPTSPVVGEPVHIKVVAYDSVLQEVYNVTCNVTVTNQTDVLWFANFSGKPAQYEFTWWRPDNLTLEIFCISEINTTLTKIITINFRQPELDLTPKDPNWGRPSTITVTAEYPYTGVPITINIGGIPYQRVMTNGIAKITGVTFTEPTDITVYFLNKTYTFHITPKQPTLYLEAPETGHINQPINITTKLVDDKGELPVSVPITLQVTPPCGDGTIQAQTGETITFLPQRSGSCSITATTSIMGNTLSDEATIVIPPPQVVNYTFTLDHTDPWNYTIKAEITLTENVTGTLTIDIDGIYTDTLTKTNTTWQLTIPYTFQPGLHVVTLTFYADTLNITDTKIIIAPRHPYEINLNDQYILPFGIEEYTIIPPPLYYYTYPVNTTTEKLVVYYPGNDYYLPAKKLILVHYILPNITITPSDNNIKIHIENAVPTALITLYCDGKLSYQANLTGTTLSKTLPLTCTNYKLLYTINGKTLIYTGEEITAPQVTTTCQAGTPCTPVQPSPMIKAVFIGGTPYTPGNQITLEPGEYTITIILAGNITLHYELTVLPPQQTIYVYRSLDGKWIYIEAPPDAQVTVVLEDGTHLTLGEGEHTLHSPVANIYSNKYNVKIINMFT